jgi:glycosyltransferase involved in cell wall biosynthesis
MINYSIIIPFRGKAELLYKAVASVPDRGDAEVIVVDNNLHPLPSADVPHKQQATVVYLTSDPNMGAGRARNEGLKHVRGKWILFLDADDYFTDDAFAAFDQYLESDADIIYFDADSINLVSGQPSNRHRMVHQFLTTYLETGNEDSIRYLFVNPISKMMRASFVMEGGFHFEEIKVANDQMFSIWTGHAARKVMADAAKVYMITAGEKNTSLTKTKSAENQFIRYQVAIRQYHFMESIGRKDLRFHLLSFVVHAFSDFGIKEGVKYVKYAMKEKVNIFLR